MREEKSVVSSFLWKNMGSISSQVISLVISIILARLLDTSDYGLIALVNVFTTFANYFVSDGISSVLIQKKNADKLDFFTLCYFNLIVALALYVVLYFASPYISLFYGEKYVLLTPVLRILGLKIFFTAILSVQHAYISRKAKFKYVFFSTIISTVIAGSLGVTLAYSGAGVWALVVQNVLSSTLQVVVLAGLIRKPPELIFSISRLKKLLPFGMKILGSGLLSVGFEEIKALIIGKKYSSEHLAFYDRGKQFPNLIISNSSSSLSAVLFPRLAQQQDNIPELKRLMKKAIRLGAYVFFPMMCGLFAVAESFVVVVLSEKWLPCVPLLRLFCVVYMFYPIHSMNMQAVKSLGNGNVYVKLETTKRIIETVVLCITAPISVNAIVVGMLITSTLFTALNAYPSGKTINYPFKEQIMDVAPALINSFVMMVVVYLLGYVQMAPLPKLCLQVVVGFLTYWGGSILTGNQEYYYLLKFFGIKWLKKEKKKWST